MVDVDTEVSTALDIERRCRAQFAHDVKIKHIIVLRLESSKSSYTTVFEAEGGDIYAFTESQASLTFGEVTRIIRHMGMEAETFIPPAGKFDYFKRYGIEAFQASFPGRHITEHDNLSFYQSLAPYNPAFVKIAAIHGKIRGFIPVVEQWYPAADYTYKHIEVQ